MTAGRSVVCTRQRCPHSAKMPGSYPLCSNNWNKGVGWIGPETARISPSNNLTVKWAALAYFSSAVPQRAELKSTSLERLMRTAHPLTDFAEAARRCDARELERRVPRK